MPVVDAPKSIVPVEEFITKPEPELNVPPLVPVIVGVGFDPDLQYSAAA